jgi:hypothetical protein
MAREGDMMVGALGRFTVRRRRRVLAGTLVAAAVAGRQVCRTR